MAVAATGVVNAQVLSETQEKALGALRGGSSIVQAAEMAGVHRTTVFRWLERDSLFRASYNAWQNEVAASAQGRLLKLTDKAVQVMEEALESGDRRAAALILQHVGALRRHQPQSTDPKVLDLQMDLGRRRQEFGALVGLIHQILKRTGMTAEERQQYIRRRGVVSLENSGSASATPSAVANERQMVVDAAAEVRLADERRLAEQEDQEDDADEDDNDTDDTETDTDEIDSEEGAFDLMRQLSQMARDREELDRATG